MPGSSSVGDQHYGWPQEVGIVAMEVYFPSQYVDQTELEQFDGVSAGKYTIGLGQSRMGFCSDREDINSLCLTVVQRLMERNNISYSELFEDSGNTDMEGVDTTNACFGGTAAVMNAVNWIESSSWDGRYALVIAADIAVYASGNARCTGGAGVRSCHMQHVYDFYKPDMASEYPVVDGKLSIQCYLHALDSCYKVYCRKAKQVNILKGNSLLDAADAFLFHQPYYKLVMKSFARILLNDFLSDPDPDYKGRYAGLEAFRDTKLEDTYFDRNIESAVLAASKNLFEMKTKPSTGLAVQVGNMYTPSLYGGLAYFVASNTIEQLVGKRVVLFSYGSGLASAMFSLRVTEHKAPGSALERLFEELFKNSDNVGQAPYNPIGSVNVLFPGTWYVTAIDSMHRRKYERRPLSQSSSSTGDICDINMAEVKRQVQPTEPPPQAAASQ
ncbi:hypothetical protein C0Q70_16381 [Pomacea canaliculata]|uniref:Hydroxymethylglutaryl-CoA synthase n=1 Tax=Pomacea canaliculata TaxID=400727 RepID=A0A2T7NPM2_POMCA|nr:hypothetical protein C0Q70_16381 [Pomacea canaliculata]